MCISSGVATIYHWGTCLDLNSEVGLRPILNSGLIDAIESVQRRFTKRLPGLFWVTYKDRIDFLSLVLDLWLIADCVPISTRYIKFCLAMLHLTFIAFSLLGLAKPEVMN